mgnify:FL=1
MTLKVEHRKATNVAESIDVHGKLAKEVDDRSCAVRQRVPEHERRDDDGEELLNEHGDLHLEELAERVVHLEQERRRSVASRRKGAKERTSAECSLPRHSTGR